MAPAARVPARSARRSRSPETQGPALAGDAQEARLVARFLRSRAYQHSFCLDLIALARDRQAASWRLRCLAVLMLEHQVLMLRANALDDIADLFAALGIPSTPVTDDRSDALRSRFLELRSRLERLNRVHAAIDGVDTTDEASLSDFVQASRSECKLTLARYLFSPEEVVEHIVGMLETSTGLSDVRGLDQPWVREETARCVDQLPPYETAIVAALARRATVYWVSPRTSSRVNGLVEYPLGTVVAVIKPPGSDLEIELKRVGLRGERLWDVVFARNGEEVPTTHRLQGGSMGYYLRWEAASSAALARVYRLIHGVDPPISRSATISTIYGVPDRGRERHIVDYFTRLSGAAGRDETRRAMQHSIAAYCREMRTHSLPVRSDVELAAQFLGQVGPTQSILVGTSSFRLDRLAEYLSPDGADRYFAQLLSPTPSPAEAKAFADEIAEEVLGLVTPHGARFESHAQYLDALFAASGNRARAERCYRRAMRDIGVFWGTLLGMRAHTYGESFVARNVGLKSVWADGEWTVRILFMDHDGTYLSGQRSPDFRPLSAMPGMAGDDMHIWGAPTVTGDVELLRAIYRVDDDAERTAKAALRDELRRAFQQTRRAILEDPRVRACFSAEFTARFTDWDEMVLGYLALGDEPGARDEWVARTSRWLEDKRYGDKLRREHLRAVEQHVEFLRKYAWLY